jgi:hypothetical protein
VTWLTPKEAAALSGLSEREIFRLADAGEIHVAETPDRFMHVCPASAMRRGKVQ